MSPIFLAALLYAALNGVEHLFGHQYALGIAIGMGFTCTVLLVSKRLDERSPTPSPDTTGAKHG